MAQLIQKRWKTSEGNMFVTNGQRVDSRGSTGEVYNADLFCCQFLFYHKKLRQSWLDRCSLLSKSLMICWFFE